MKGCELCSGTARMYCESDQASLCFDCDARVHAANFLVARHSRVLLCRTCQFPTPWKAQGPRLGPTISVCDRCVSLRSSTTTTNNNKDNDDDDQMDEEIEEDEQENDDDDDDRESGGEEASEDDEEEGEEQVVPLTMNDVAAPPPQSSSEEDSTAATMRLKRFRGNVDLPSSSYSSQDQQGYSSSRSRLVVNRTGALDPVQRAGEDEVTSYSSSAGPLKDPNKSEIILSGSHRLAMDLMSFSARRPPI